MFCLQCLRRPTVQFKCAGLESFSLGRTLDLEQGGKFRIPLVLVGRQEGNLMVSGQMAERDMTGRRYEFQGSRNGEQS